MDKLSKVTVVSATVLGAALFADVNTVLSASNVSSSVVNVESGSKLWGGKSTASYQNKITKLSNNLNNTTIATNGAIVSNPNASVATKNDGGISHTIALIPSGENNTNSTSQAIVDIDQSKGSFGAKVKIDNTNNSDRKVISAVLLPQTYSTEKDGAQVVLDSSKMKNFSLGLNDEKITYAVQAGQYKTLAELQAAGSFSWDKVVGVRIEGLAKAGQSYSAVLPLTIANYSNMQEQLTDLVNQKFGYDTLTQSKLRQFSLTENFYYFDDKNTLHYGAMNTINGRIAKEETNIEAAVNKSNITNYAKILVQDGNKRKYLPANELNEMIDENGNAVLPAITSQEFSYYNFGLSGTKSNKLYTDGFYTISLEKIFNAIKNRGYSVNVFPNGTTAWKQYIYVVNSSPNWIVQSIRQGNDLSTDDTSTIANNFYIQVQKVFDVQDLTLWVGDKFDPTKMGNGQSLIKAHIDFTDQSTMKVTESKDLTAKDLIINSDVDTSKPGVYHVTYSYKLGDGSLISATSKITVLSKNNPIKPVKPGKKEINNTNKKDSNKDNNKLPQTGNKAGIFALLGLGIISISSFLFKKKH